MFIMFYYYLKLNIGYIDLFSYETKGIYNLKKFILVPVCASGFKYLMSMQNEP